jgi:tRNA uridine 5-carboxymethylaminomethyl modification enzyme
MQNKFDVIVIGGGHSGLEAASANTRMGMKTAFITMSVATLCKPSCNPNIGGVAKGHIAKEVDALGGAQGYLADNAGIHFKMLNTSKGPAIWSPRAQIDKDMYPKIAYQYLLNIFQINETDGTLTMIEDTVMEILVEKNKVKGCITKKNETLYCKAMVLCAGTFLNAKMFIGQEIFIGGRWEEPRSEKISDLLVAYGIKKGRLKTGTPPRIHKDSVDFSKCKTEAGDEPPIPFSYRTKEVKNKIVCYETETNINTHEVLKTGFAESPMYSGLIEGAGPRYCPSIEDKITRFSHRDNHKILLEPEGLNTNSIYVNGYSTSLPKEVQVKGLRTIVGLEKCEIINYGYAIEYDFFFPHQNKFTLETKSIENLFFAGQINGTSGYEEAACQGLVAGINAALKIKKDEPFILKRSEAYTGVLIDDLVNKGTNEPYRMFTSLAEYRLLLRQDNAGERLAKYARKFGLVPDWYYDKIVKQQELLKNAIDEAKTFKIKKETINDYLINIGESVLTGGTHLDDIVKRGKVEIKDVLKLIPNLTDNLEKIKKDDLLVWKLEVEIKYEGYITKQLREVEFFLENENKKIPSNFNYDALNSLSREALQKLKEIRPASIGQASRILGVSATDIAIIQFYMRQNNK